MSNVNRPTGLIPVSHLAGGIPHRLGAYTIANDLNQNLFRGDPVTLTGTGRNITIATGATANPVLGAFAGVRYVNGDGEQIFSAKWPAQSSGVFSDIEALVYDDPFQVFKVQVSGSAGLVEGDVGRTSNLVAGSGNSFTGLSGWLLDQTELDEDAADQVRILGLARDIDNEYGQYAKALVQIQRHSYGGQPDAGV